MEGEGPKRWGYEEEPPQIEQETIRAIGWDPDDERSREEHRRRTEVRIASGKKVFRTFAQRIRYITDEGEVLIAAMFELFQRARDERKDNLMIEAATWLADRGFGKPVQVGQLLDGEGNAVAFTLWQPARPDGEGTAETITFRKEEEEGMVRYLPPAEAMENPRVHDLEKKDGYAEGPARAWGKGEAEPRKGE